MRRTSPIRRALAAPLAAALAAGALGGCVDAARARRLLPEGVNVESPVAGAVLSVQSARLEYPSFRDVPPKVTGLPAPVQFSRRVGGLKAERADLLAWEAQNPPVLSDTEGYAATTRDGVPVTSSDAPGADQTQRSVDWAKRARDAAKPPAPSAPKP